MIYILILLYKTINKAGIIFRQIDKNVVIDFSAHDAFLWWPYNGLLIINRLESQIFKNNLCE
jgi:hypothetical protein